MRTLIVSLALILLICGCVPEPANRASHEASRALAVPTATPVPTPAGPTPTPSFVRPTPTPQPTFLLYLVVKGDTLGAIAKRFKTTTQSIAYWNRVTYPSLDPESSTYAPDRVRIGWTLSIIPNATVDPEDLPTLPPDAP
jgi:nucleoid-associated protein YgaU